MTPEERQKYTTYARLLGLATPEEAKAKMEAERVAKRPVEQAPPSTPTPAPAPVAVAPMPAAPAAPPADTQSAVAHAAVDAPVSHVRSIPKHRVTRSPKTTRSRFARIDNSLLQNRKLSFRARGLLAYILSQPTNFDYSAERLSAVTTEGEKAVLSAIRELERLGHTWLVRTRGDGGKFITQRFFSEEPRPQNGETVEHSPKPQNGASAVGVHRTTQNRPSVGRGSVDRGSVDRGSVARGSVKGGILETTPGKTTIDETKIDETTLSQSARLPLPFSLQQAQALGAKDSPELKAAWEKWCRHRFEKNIPTRSTVEAHRATFLELGADAPATVSTLISRGYHNLEPIQPRTSGKASAPARTLPDNLRPF